MARELPVVCSLGAGDLKQRLAAIGEIGAESLLGRWQDGGRHLLRFRADARTRQRLERIIEAEAACCAFLDLELTEGCCDLTLRVAAPEVGQATADGFAAAFGASRGIRPG